MDAEDEGVESPPLSPLPPPARPGIDWWTRGVACDRCATSRWTDCDTTGNERCTTCKHYSGSRGQCRTFHRRSWADILVAQAKDRLKRYQDPRLPDPAPRGLDRLNPMPGLPPNEVPTSCNGPPPLPEAIQRNAFRAFGVQTPANFDLGERRGSKVKSYGKASPPNHGHASGSNQSPGHGQTRAAASSPVHGQSTAYVQNTQRFQPPAPVYAQYQGHPWYLQPGHSPHYPPQGQFIPPYQGHHPYAQPGNSPHYGLQGQFYAPQPPPASPGPPPLSAGSDNQQHQHGGNDEHSTRALRLELFDMLVASIFQSLQRLQEFRPVPDRD